MKFKKIMLASMILLAILMIGAVSAGDDADFNETLTVEQTQEASVNASFDDNLNDFEDDVLSSSQDEALLEDEIAAENLHPWVSGHEPVNADWNPWIANVHGDDDVVDAGGVNLTIFDDVGDCIFTGLKHFPEDADENNDVIWTFDELRDGGIFTDAGTYTISLKYINGNVEFDLGNDHIFRLTEVNYNICDNVYFRYPFDVIKVWDERFDIKVYVGGNPNPVEPAGDNPFRWTLNDLGIDSAGDYEITIEAYDEDNNLIEELPYNLNVFDNVDIELYGDDLGVENWDLAGPVLYLVCSDEYKNKHFKLAINGDDFNDFDYDSPLNWTLSDLGIDRNGDYDIKLLNELGDEVDAVWLNVNGIISQENFNPWVSSHEPVTADWDPEIVNVGCDVREGSINLTISDGEDIFSDVKDIEDYNVIWRLDELRENNILNDAKTYAISLKYVNGDDEIDLGEYNFTLTNVNYEICDGDIYINYPFDVIRVGDSGVNIEVTVGDDPNPVEPNGDNPLRWTLNNLGIDSVGEYEITIKAFREDESIETFKYTLIVDDDASDFRAFSNQLGVEKWDLDNPVLYLVSPEKTIGQTLNLRINDDEFDIEITSTLMNWTLGDLGIDHDDWYEIRFTDEDDREVATAGFDVRCVDESIIRAHIWNEEDDGVLYSDMKTDIIDVFLPEGTSGLLYVLVDNEVKYVTVAKYYSTDDEDEYFGGYCWNNYELNMTGGNEYNITLVFFNGEVNETLASEIVNVVIFDNTTFRARYSDGRGAPEIFCPDNSQGTIMIEVYNYDEHRIEFTETYPIKSDYYNKWTTFRFEDYDFDSYDAIISINGEEISVEEDGREPVEWYGLDFIAVPSGEVYPDDTVMFIWDVDKFENVTVTVTNGDYTFTKKLSEFGIGEWLDGRFNYYVTFEDLDSFENFNDKDIITFTMESNMGKQSKTRCLEKQDGSIILHVIEDDSTDLYYLFEILFKDEEEGDTAFNISDENADFIRVTVLENVTKAEISITSGDKVVFYKVLRDLDYEFDYVYAMNVFREIYALGDMNFTSLNDKDLVNFTLIYDGEVMVNREYVYHIIDEDFIEFYEFDDHITAEVRWGDVGDPEFGQGERDGRLIILDIPNQLNVTEGSIQITNDDGEVLYSISLSDITNVVDEDGVTSYSVLADEFDYDKGMPDGVNLTFSFNYNDTQLIFAKGIRIGDSTYRHVIPEQVEEFFKITIPDRVLVNGEDNVIYIQTTNSANRQSVPIGIGEGYFTVFVNGKKIEDLGRLIRVNGETELNVSRLESDFRKLYIYLEDLNITDNGVYNIEVMYETYAVSPTTGIYKTPLYNNNITLTSNVKANYENESIELLTGYGIDPILLYLDTYYGDINSTTGIITVSNSDNVTILEKNIKDLTYEDGRYVLRYSDFENKDFGDRITVKYGDGNERNGETSLDVLWRDMDPTDFNTTVMDDVNDYYGNFINLNIPELINTGQIIVTVMFKNNHGSSISNMSVDTDFDSKAVYRFNVADIKANYGNDFALALYDLGFYEDNGNYAVDVKFTADNVSVLNVTNSTINVEF